MSSTNRVIIVDEQDVPIGLKTYGELTYKDIYRVTGLWLTDKKSGDALLQQRNWSKHNDPGKWQCAASGTVEEGETYEQNMVKEIEEEIGLTSLLLAETPKIFIDDGKHRFFCQSYAASTDKETTKITIQESELEATRWIGKKELVRELTEEPEKYVPSMISDMRMLGILPHDKVRPKTIITIALQDDWEKAQGPGYYVKSTITSNLHDVGFIHCSFPGQTVDIANRHFHDHKELLLLFVDPDKLRSPIRYEGALSGRAGVFPHIYGPLNVDAVTDTAVIAQTNDGRFIAPSRLEREKLSD